ncbi:MAG: DUF4102 domain-containing protein [Bauldia sp.]|nr:DUF4102 domain-containing protein [Bauldia sp.]
MERKLALGRYPEVTLVAARKARDTAREAASAGNDPSAARRRDRILAKMAAVTTFAAVAEEYIAKAQDDLRRAVGVAARLKVARLGPVHPSGV